MLYQPVKTPREILMDEVREIAERHGVPMHDLMGRTRVRAAVKARNKAYYHVFTKLKFLTTTGAFFGRDHSTVAYGIGRHLDDKGRGDNWMSRMAAQKRLRAVRWQRAKGRRVA